MCIALHWFKQLYFYFQNYHPCQEKLVYSLRRLKSIRWTIQHCTTCQFRAIEEIIFAVEKIMLCHKHIKSLWNEGWKLDQSETCIYTTFLHIGYSVWRFYCWYLLCWNDGFFSLISSINKQPCITVSLYIWQEEVTFYFLNFNNSEIYK